MVFVVTVASAGGCSRAIPPVGGVVDIGGGRVARQPDGVVVERKSALPSPVARADAAGVVTLRQPPRPAAIERLVATFFEAWQKESIDSLIGLLTEDAGPMSARTQGRSALVESWRQRLQAHPYGRLAGLELAAPERIELYGWEDLGQRGAPPRPSQMLPEEIYVRVPLELTQLSGETFFGDDVIMLLRPEGGQLRIAAYEEVDAGK